MPVGFLDAFSTLSGDLSRTIILLAGLVGVYYVFTSGWAFIYEVGFTLLSLIGIVLLADRLLVTS